jgi:sacsin
MSHSWSNQRYANIRYHRAKAYINNAVALALKDPLYCLDRSFEIGIQFKSGEESTAAKYLVHHRIQGAGMDAGLRQWAQSQKFTPWVAVAARIPTTKMTDTTDGSLFTVLPLPIKTSQPLKIHGMFSLTPDRARLHELGDSSTQNQNLAGWNSWLFEQPIPIAWTKLLARLTQLYPQQSAFETWPHLGDSSNGHLSICREKVFQIIDKVRKAWVEIIF